MVVAASVVGHAQSFASSNGLRAIILGAVWIGAIVGVDFALRVGLKRYEKRIAERDARVAARRRTTLNVVRRVTVVLLVLVAAWSVLSIFPATAGAAKAFLASSAALGVIAGIALKDPLGNLGSGILLALIQPARLGDRITVDIRSGQETHTGTVERMSLAYTTLVTDEGRQIFVPNLMVVKNVIVNHSRGDRRRAVSVRLPVAIDASIDDARRVAFKSARAVEKEADQELELQVNLTEITGRESWLEITGFAPADADVADIETKMRKRALAGLLEEALLPAQDPVLTGRDE
ncbi:MAG: mechanosensitive ion channel [Acidimicrobiaceae bacterium]|nr:mechanosensitive ion channel [Acidimicrobiaceae bacterium]